VTKAVIPAAGLGTRILPASKTIPKEMLTLVDRPMIQYVVEEAAGAGITDVIIVTSPGKSALEDYFRPAPELEAALEAKAKTELLAAVRATTEIANVTYATQKEPLGLGHAVLSAREQIGDEPFAVLLPDELFGGSSLLRSLINTYERFDASVIAVMEMPEDEISNYGVVDPEWMDDSVVRMKGFVEKPPAEEAKSNLGSIGRYVLTPDVFDALARTKPGTGGEIQLTDGIAALGGYAFVHRGRRQDAGRPLGYLRAIVELALQREDLGKEFGEFLSGLDL
jgi:UTP--glucose-1-phosphate uridylyltransferase